MVVQVWWAGGSIAKICTRLRALNLTRLQRKRLRDCVSSKIRILNNLCDTITIREQKINPAFILDLGEG